MSKSRRKTVRVDSSVSKVIEELLDGNIVEIDNGSLAKKVGWRFRDLKEKGVLKNSYDQKERHSFYWLTEEVSERNLYKTRSSPFGDVWEMLFSKTGRMRGKKEPKKPTWDATEPPKNKSPLSKFLDKILGK